jgi:thioredoxin reductase (NADPH)
VLPDGRVLERATVRALAERLGWIAEPRCPEYDRPGRARRSTPPRRGCAPCWSSARRSAGQAGTSSLIENFLGFPGGISGADLAERARQHAVAFGAEILLIREGIRAEFHDGLIHFDLAGGGKLVARTNICATGVEYRRLDLPGEQHFYGAGLYYGAGASEAPLCRREHVHLVSATSGNISCLAFHSPAV